MKNKTTTQILKEISNARKWQLKQKTLGRCVRCGAKAVTKSFCEIHRKMG